MNLMWVLLHWVTLVNTKNMVYYVGTAPIEDLDWQLSEEWRNKETGLSAEGQRQVTHH